MIKQMDHEKYPKSLKRKTIDELKYIIKDASEAEKANPDGPNAGYYADEVLYANMELAKRNERSK